MSILDLSDRFETGMLFRAPDDKLRVEAFIPPLGQEGHAANLVELPGGDLLCAWFAGSREGVSDIYIALSRLPHGATQWTEPVRVSQDVTRSEQNPVFFSAPDGMLWLLYTAQETRGCSKPEWQRRLAAGEVEEGFVMEWTAVIRRRLSSDGGHTWGPVETFMDRPSSFCRSPIVVLSNDDWLFPTYYSGKDRAGATDIYSTVQISEDAGRTWTEHPMPDSNGYVQATVLELDPGQLIAFFRSRAADNIYVSHSTDYGRVWTQPERTVLPNNNSSVQAIRLASGSIAMVYNHAGSGSADPNQVIWPHQRYPLTVALSEDGGRTWPFMRHIDTGDNFAGEQNRALNRRCSYPSIIQTRDGLIHIAYSYRGRQCIKYVRFTEDWIRNQFDWLYPAED
jgi:predicted neuraminidase